MRRRDFVALGLGVGFCKGCEVVEQFPLRGNPPWHLWGNTKVLSAQPTAAATFATASGQLLKINYGRPETWSFFFGAQIGGVGQTVGPLTVNVFIDLFTGVGRDVFNTEQPAQTAAPGALPRFLRFTWDNLAPGANLFVVPKKWSSVGAPILMVDSDPTSGVRPEWIVGQDIQVQARMTVVAAAPQPSAVTASVSGFLAPRSHVRPDWFKKENQFLGGEIGGS